MNAIATAPSVLRSPEGFLARHDWTLAGDRTHLNHGSYGAVPRAAQRRQQELRSEMDANPCAWFTGLPERVAEARAHVAAYLAVRPEELALVPNASAGVTTVLDSVVTTPGAHIVTTSHAYGAVLEACHRAARRVGGGVTTVPLPLAAGPADVTARVGAALTGRTALIVADQVTSASARLLPVGGLARLAACHGVPLLVDGAHAPGLLARPVPELTDGFWVGNLHKWACAPRGTAALVARGPRARELRPLIDSWGYGLDFPARFDHVGTQDVTPWLAAESALGFVDRRYGWERVRRYSRELADYGERILADAFEAATGEPARVDVASPAGPMRLVRLPAGLAGTPADAQTVRSFLAATLGIETAITSLDGRGYLRLSAHAYNTPDDYETTAERAVPALVAYSHRR